MNNLSDYVTKHCKTPGCGYWVMTSSPDETEICPFCNMELKGDA